jgi:hypothetical protein
VYFHSGLQRLNGKCTLPPLGRRRRGFVEADGCVVSSRTVPDFPGGDRRFTEGKTAVHEIRHWVGLLHTFHGSTCFGKGDEVDDTAPAKKQTFGCMPYDTVIDTCPDDDLPDPNDNHMSYAHDSCRTKFTPGQV